MAASPGELNITFNTYLDVMHSPTIPPFRTIIIGGLAVDAILFGFCYLKQDVRAWHELTILNLGIYGGLACYEGVACLKNLGAGSSLPRMPSMIKKFVLAMASKAAISVVAFPIIFSSWK